MGLIFDLAESINIAVGALTGKSVDSLHEWLADQATRRRLSAAFKDVLRKADGLDPTTKEALLRLADTKDISDLLTIPQESDLSPSRQEWQRLLSATDQAIAKELSDAMSRAGAQVIIDKLPREDQLLHARIDQILHETAALRDEIPRENRSIIAIDGIEAHLHVYQHIERGVSVSAPSMMESGNPQIEPAEAFPTTETMGAIVNPDGTYETGRESRTPLNNLPYLRNRYFTGRDRLLAEVHSSLSEAHSMTLTQAITGIGGIGKSQTALEYAYRSFNEYDTIWWINSESRSSMIDSVTKFATMKGLAKHYDDQSLIILRFTRWFEEHPHSLLILDNVEELSGVAELLPKGRSQKILMTTRLSSQTIGRSVAIDIFTTDEAIEFLAKRTGVSDPSAARDLSENLHFFPLALEQAAAYICATPGMGYRRYTELLIEYGVKLFEQDVPMTNYNRSVVETFSLSFERLVHPASISLLNLAAYLAPDSLSRGFLLSSRHALPQDLRTAIQSQLEWDAAVRDVTKFSLVKIKDDNLVIHRLVQDVIRHRHDSEDWLKIAVSLLLSAIPDDSSEPIPNNFSIVTLLPHIDAIRGIMLHSELSSASNKQIAEIFRRTTGLLCRNDPVLALSYGESALRSYADAPQFRLARAYTNHYMGLSHKILNNYAAALTHYEEALRLRQQELPDDDPLVAATENNLGIVYKNMERFAEARPIAERNISRKTAALGSSHPDTLKSRDTLANILKHLDGEWETAKALLFETMMIRQSTLGKNHLDTSMSYGNIGTLYSEAGKHTDALRWFFMTTDIEQKQLGNDHPQIAMTYFNIGRSLRSLKRRDEAKPWLEKAYSIQLRKLGNEHPSTKATRLSLQELDSS